MMNPHNTAGAESGHTTKSLKPHINVTPLIDVLLVLLIIFMVVAPLKMARFMTQVPSPPDENKILNPHPNTLVVIIRPDRSLMLNQTSDLGSVAEPGKLSEMLVDVFRQRTLNHDYAYQLRDRIDLPEALRIEKTVFIKAPRALPYGEVTHVIDAIKGAGAGPIGLQIDELD